MVSAEKTMVKICHYIVDTFVSEWFEQSDLTLLCLTNTFSVKCPLASSPFGYGGFSRFRIFICDYNFMYYRLISLFGTFYFLLSQHSKKNRFLFWGGIFFFPKPETMKIRQFVAYSERFGTVFILHVAF